MKNRIFKILVGSHNYNLNTEKSDKDYKVFIVPSLRNLVFNEKLHSSTTSELEDIETKSILDLPNLIFKSNPSYLELFFSQEFKILNPLSKGINNFYDFITKNNEKLVRSNLPKLYYSMLGIMNEKKKNMFKGTSTTKDLVEKYGYCPKNLHHLIRISDLLVRYASTKFTDYSTSLVYIGDARNELIKIKSGEINFSLEDLNKLMEEKFSLVESYKDVYLSNEVDYQIYSHLKEQVYQLIKNNIDLS